MRKVLAAGVIAAMGLTAAPLLAEEPVCGQRDLIVHQLETKHGEFRQSAGLQDDSIMVEVFASSAGTWTILFTRPSGISCFMAVGRAWETGLTNQEQRAGTPL